MFFSENQSILANNLYIWSYTLFFKSSNKRNRNLNPIRKHLKNEDYLLLDGYYPYVEEFDALFVIETGVNLMLYISIVAFIKTDALQLAAETNF